MLLEKCHDLSNREENPPFVKFLVASKCYFSSLKFDGTETCLNAIGMKQKKN